MKNFSESIFNSIPVDRACDASSLVVHFNVRSLQTYLQTAKMVLNNTDDTKLQNKTIQEAPLIEPHFFFFFTSLAQPIYAPSQHRKEQISVLLGLHKK